MLRNVEIKARVRDLEDIKRRAVELSGGLASDQLQQHDVFYCARAGRLKLRHQAGCGGTGTGPGPAASLIYYDRPDADGPKLSQYEMCHFSTADAPKIHSILEKTLGIVGELKKTRYLYLVGQTRVHVDVVAGLGTFMELEVVLDPNQSVEEGQEVAKDIQQKLGVGDEDLLSGAYMDLLLKKSAE